MFTINQRVRLIGTSEYGSVYLVSPNCVGVDWESGKWWTVQPHQLIAADGE